jgi:hypothetical protein
MLGLTKNSRDYGYDNNNGLGARAVCPTSNGQVAARLANNYLYQQALASAMCLSLKALSATESYEIPLNLRQDQELLSLITYETTIIKNVVVY